MPARRGALHNPRACRLRRPTWSPDVAREVFGDPTRYSRGVSRPGSRRAARVPTKGGWIVNGAWTFGSGNRLSKWLGGHAQLCDEAGTPLHHPDGRIARRTMIFPRSSAMVREDLWDVVGLVGTGSDSYSVTDLFVPAQYSLVPRATPRNHQLPEGVKPIRIPSGARRHALSLLQPGCVSGRAVLGRHRLGAGDARCVHRVGEEEVTLQRHPISARRYLDSGAHRQRGCEDQRRPGLAGVAVARGLAGV